MICSHYRYALCGYVRVSRFQTVSKLLIKDEQNISRARLNYDRKIIVNLLI